MKLPKITKLPSGAYNAQVQIDGRRVSVTSKSRKEVERKLYNLKLKNVNTVNNLTLYDGIDRYVESKQNILSPSTLRGYGVIQRNRFKSVMFKKMGNVKNWQAVVNDEAKTCSPKTLKNSWGLVRAVLAANYVNPGVVLLPSVVKKERAWIQPNQIPLFLDSIHGNKYEIAYLACLHGLRASEMLALDKKDISDEITVNKAIVQGQDHRLTLKHMTKNVTSTRKVPVFIPRLTELVKEKKPGRIVRSNSHTLNSHLKEICEANGLPVVTLHELRHTYVSLMYHLGISEEQAMRFGGYSDRATMREIYTHLADEDRKKAVQKMQFFIKNADEMQTDISEVS